MRNICRETFPGTMRSLEKWRLRAMSTMGLDLSRSILNIIIDNNNVGQEF